MPVRLTLMVGARACPLEPNDARWLAAERPDAFGDVETDMRRGDPAVSNLSPTDSADRTSRTIGVP